MAPATCRWCRRCSGPKGLPLDLAYVPLVESAFKPSALSRAKARGIWQFMSGTGIENGLQHDWYIDERADPEKATRAAAKYLKAPAREVRRLAPGAGVVQRRAGSRAALDESLGQGRLLGHLVDARDTCRARPATTCRSSWRRSSWRAIRCSTGWRSRRSIEPLTDVVRLTAPADVRRIAEWIDVPVQVLQDLNPELRRWTTPVRMTDYDLTVPMGKAEVLSARLGRVVARGPRAAQPLHRAQGRDHRHDRAQAEGEARRPGAGQLPVRAGAAVRQASS